MNTTQLECFLAVSNFLNFSRAAEQLRITQPAVSHQINTLENELGAKLFHRTSKSVRLTEAGHLFTQYAGEILKLSGLSKARLRECREGIPLRLGIGCRNFLELKMIRPVLARLRREREQVLPILRLVPYDSLENLLEEGDVQVIFSFRESVPSRAVYRELVRCPAVCICAQEHPLASQDQVTVQQLKESGRIATCPPPVYPPALLSAQSQIAGGRSPEQMLFCDNLEIVYTLVEAGYAYAVMADLPGARQPGLAYIPIRELAPLSYGVAYLEGQGSTALGEFLALMDGVLAEQAR